MLNVFQSTRKGVNQSVARKSIHQGALSRSVSGVSKKSDPDRRSLRMWPRLIDSNGNDLTPTPLLTDDKRTKDPDKETPADAVSQGSLPTQSLNSAQALAGTNMFGFTKSQLGSSTHTAEGDSEFSDDIADASHTHHAALYTEVKSAKTEPPPQLTEQDLDSGIGIEIEETDNIWLLDIIPRYLSNESEEAPHVQKRNETYEKLVQSKIGNDRYVERAMNTFDNDRIIKSLQTERITYKEEALMSTIWDMWDSFKAMQEEAEGNLEEDADTKADTPVEGLSAAGSNQDELSKSRLQPDPTKSLVKSGTVTSGGPHETISSHSESDIFGTRHSTATSNLAMDITARNEEILRSDSMKQTLFIMERALNTNTYYERLLYYRDLPYYADLLHQRDLAEATSLPAVPQSAPSEASLDLPQSATRSSATRDSSKSATGPPPAQTDAQASEVTQASLTAVRTGSVMTTLPHLDLLWTFQSPLTKGRNITSMAWNKHNPDIVAVGYGEFDFTDQKRSGLVACWSLKNVEYAERVYLLPAGATAVDWSKTHPSLLAVGMFDGVIFVFDARKWANEPVVDTTHSAGRHLGPVRQLQWVVRQSGRSEEDSEVLISISIDGRVTQWAIRKGFECSDLMKLKRVTTRVPGSVKQKKADALISRFGHGCSIAFNPRDTSIYLVGTEDGHIHKCSCSYNEQYLENYFGHTSPVYAIEWSPFMSDLFLSCAADWTIRLWHSDHLQPVITFQSSVKSVNSISWSPRSSVVFACVNDGAVEVWNLQSSTLDPIIVETVAQDRSAAATSVLFAQNSESLLVGDSQGSVCVYKVKNLPATARNQQAQAENLDKIVQGCLASQMS